MASSSTSTNAPTADPLTREQRARCEALHTAREVTKATSMASATPPGAGDLVYIAEFILHGGVVDSEEVETVLTGDGEPARAGYSWDGLRQRIAAKPRAHADDLLDVLVAVENRAKERGGVMKPNEAYDEVLAYLDRVAAPYVQAGIIAPEAPDPR